MGGRWRWVGAMGLLCSLLIFCFTAWWAAGPWGTPGMGPGGELQQGTARHWTARFHDYVGDPLWPVLTHLLLPGLTWWVHWGGVQQGGSAPLR